MSACLTMARLPTTPGNLKLQNWRRIDPTRICTSQDDNLRAPAGLLGPQRGSSSANGSWVKAHAGCAALRVLA
jgi:hypothetical protein